ncbi:MAG: Gfo/Idh/MocA family oxidoreductase [Verrucomicrobiales bacterium]
MRTTRRSFLAASAMTMTALSASRVVGGNDKIRIGMIGLGGRGSGTAGHFAKIEGVEIAYLCDADQVAIDRAKARFPDAKTTQDMRRLLDDKDIDVVVVSTGNHWHVLASIWACQAGKDVYVEKPISHNIWEGRKLVEAARKYDRIVQGGTQQRSDALQDEIKAYLDGGDLGAMKYVRCNRYGMRESIGAKRSTPLVPPTSVDYNLWLGPAADEPIYRENLHYDWHWVWNTGNGELGNWGPHILDDLRNVVFRDKVALPKRVLAAGGRLAWNDAGETPNTHFVYMDTGVVPVIVDVHNLPRGKGQKAGDNYKRRRTGAFLVIECENGYYAGGRGGGAAYMEGESKPVKRFKGDAGELHAANFIAAVRSRKKEELNAEIEQIHYSSAWCHLGNISYQLAEKKFDRQEAEEQIKGYQPWTDVIDDFYAHLEANEIDPKTEDIKLGAMLEIDPARETFIGESATPDALKLLRRDYREGFVVPEQV